MYILRNKVQLIGCICNDPEIEMKEKGQELARLSLAINESYRDAKGKRITEPQHHTLIARGKLAKLAKKYLCKGKDVAVEGKLIKRSYVDNQGIKQAVTEIVVSELLLLGKPT